MSNILTQDPIAYQIDFLDLSEPEPEVEPNAPVTRSVWSCANLPDGVTLSESGELSGHPTVAGTYTCNITVETNWGTATKAVSITVQ